MEYPISAREATEIQRDDETPDYVVPTPVDDPCPADLFCAACCKTVAPSAVTTIRLVGAGPLAGVVTRVMTHHGGACKQGRVVHGPHELEPYPSDVRFGACHRCGVQRFDPTAVGAVGPAVVTMEPVSAPKPRKRRASNGASKRKVG